MFSQIIKEIAATTSRNEKQDLLAAQENTQHFKQLLWYAYNPFITFGVKKVPAQTTVGIETVESVWPDLHDVLDRLASRELSGNRALAAIEDCLSRLTEDEAELFTNVIKKDLRAGFSDSTTNKVFKNLIPTFELMLTEQEKKAKIVYPCYSEPKYDGMRMAALYDGNEVSFLSRGGKPIDTVDHLAEHVIEFLSGKPGMLDGEVMGNDFNETISGVKRKKKNDLTANVKYMVYDHLTLEEFSGSVPSPTRKDRYEKLHEMVANYTGDKIEVVFADIAVDVVHARELYDQNKANGHEGSILKNFDGIYEFKRVKHQSKLKPKETVDVPITGFEEGTGKYVGMLGAFIVEFEGKEARVGTGFSDEQRRDFWERRGELVDTLIEVEFMEVTKSVKDAGGVMRHPVFIRLRSLKGSKA